MTIEQTAQPIRFAFALFLATLSPIQDALAFQSATCSGNQATNETVNGKNLYVQQGQVFTVNINMPGLTSSQLTDIQTGISSWASTSGIQINFATASPGAGVITVTSSNSIPSVGEGTWAAGGGSYAANQITGGTIQFNFGYTASCAEGPCLAYDPSGANADSYLTGLAAHEMGHVLGLDEPSDASDPCTQTSTSVMGGQCGTNNNGDGISGPAPSSNDPTACDKKNVNTQTTNKGVITKPITKPTTPSSSGGGGAGKGVSINQDPGGGGCVSYEEWDDSTNTETSYTDCY